MKVLICCGGFNSFKENKVTIFALDQAKALRAYGHEVRICAGDENIKNIMCDRREE